MVRSISCGLSPRPTDSEPCGSKSTSSTLRPYSASEAPRLIVVVVLPTPPFWLHIEITRAWPWVGQRRAARGGTASAGRSGRAGRSLGRLDRRPLDSRLGRLGRHRRRRGSGGMGSVVGAVLVEAGRQVGVARSRRARRARGGCRRAAASSGAADPRPHRAPNRVCAITSSGLCPPHLGCPCHLRPTSCRHGDLRPHAPVDCTGGPVQSGQWSTAAAPGRLDSTRSW